MLRKMVFTTLLSARLSEQKPNKYRYFGYNENDETHEIVVHRKIVEKQLVSGKYVPRKQNEKIVAASNAHL